MISLYQGIKPTVRRFLPNLTVWPQCLKRAFRVAAQDAKQGASGWIDTHPALFPVSKRGDRNSQGLCKFDLSHADLFPDMGRRNLLDQWTKHCVRVFAILAHMFGNIGLARCRDPCAIKLRL